MTNNFDNALNTASALNTLVNLAEAHFGSSPLLGEVRVCLIGGVEVSVQMSEANLLVWCAVNGVTLPPSSVMEMDYTPYGGGIIAFRRLLVEVATVAGGRLMLVSCETLGTRPAATVAQAESNESVAVA